MFGIHRSRNISILLICIGRLIPSRASEQLFLRNREVFDSLGAMSTAASITVHKCAIAEHCEHVDLHDIDVSID